VFKVKEGEKFEADINKSNSTRSHFSSHGNGNYAESSENLKFSAF
jgi:hypothetical protein